MLQSGKFLPIGASDVEVILGHGRRGIPHKDVGRGDNRYEEDVFSLLQELCNVVNAVLTVF